ncbi:MAG: diguanylate cyclase [Spirochaetales bacterium]|nr:diguanylate cyclase [Spirochaetales bacterium]
MLLSALISTILALYVSNKKNSSPPLFYFSGLMFSTAVYGVSYLIELSMPTLESAIVCLMFEYTGLTFVPFFWFALAQSYQTEDSEENRTLGQKIPFYFLIPLFMILFAWTNPFHHLMYKRLFLLENVPLTILRAERGVLFLFFNGLLDLVALAGTVRMIYNIFRTKGRFQGQFILMAGAALLPSVSHLFLVFTEIIPYRLDAVPISFTLAGLLLFWGMIKIELFDLVPIARNMVLDALEDGIIVLDLKNRLIDCNNGAAAYFFNNQKPHRGKALQELNGKLFDLINQGTDLSEVIYKREEDSVFIFKISQSEIVHRTYGRMGSLFIFKDITEIQSYVKRLQHLASYDTLTGISNRRQFMEIAGLEVTRAKRSQGYFSLIILDIDHFKRVNDTYGHSAGDYALKAISRLIRENMRADSIYARYGGEEFVILLPQTTADQAEITIERLREVIETTPVQFEDKTIQITASFGIAPYRAGRTLNLETCLKQADMAMYQAKKQGRNMVCRYSPDSDEYSLKTEPISS